MMRVREPGVEDAKAPSRSMRALAAMVSVGDVTAGWLRQRLVRLQRRVVHADRRTEAMLDAVSEAAVLFDRRCSMVRINRAARRMLGIDSELMPQHELRPASTLYSAGGEELPMDRWPCALARRGEVVQGMEIQVDSPELGERRVMEATATPLTDSRGRRTHMLILYRDITESRRASLARERLAAIVDSTQDAIISKDWDGKVTSWNRAAEVMFGYTAAEMTGRSIRVLIPKNRQHEEDEILACIHAGRRVKHIETERQRKDGSLLQVSATISPIRNAAGEIVGASKIVRDITERRRIERQLQQSSRMEAIGQLAGGIAHDFNNLLGVILGNLELLEYSEMSNDRVLARVRTMQRAASRGADLSSRLLAFSRRDEISPELVDLQDLVQNTVDLAASALGPEVNIVQNSEPGMSPLFVDGSALQNALLNLLVNARDAMQGRGSITIATETTLVDDTFPLVVSGELAVGSYMCLRVSDTGAGMPPEVLERVFEPFFTTKPRGQGTGLGLAMVYGFARQSDGAVRIHSQPGHGTTVSLYLPRSGAQPQVAEAVPEAATYFRSAGSVLVVDDEEDLLEVAASHLASMGYRVVTATCAMEALRAMEGRSFDLVVTDILMPGGVNGVEMVEKIRARLPEIRALYCSGFPADAMAERRMLQLEAPILRKPYNRREFMDAVRTAWTHAPTLPVKVGQP